MTSTRRSILALAAAPLLLRPASAAPRLGEDGLYHADWFLESFLDISEDLAAASAEGKRLAVLWGLKGCPACKHMHEVHLENAEIVAFIKARFEILHLNIIGDREVTDFDGGRLGEKAFAQRYGVRATPSIQFFPRSADGLAAREPIRREVARMPGLLEPRPFLAMFRFVAEEAYAKESFANYLARAGG